jgi:hypothetical protein
MIETGRYTGTSQLDFVSLVAAIVADAVRESARRLGSAAAP